MNLQILHNDAGHHQTAAAFIRGSNPFTWLDEINSWNISIDLLECYLLPVSSVTVEVAGMFIIFKNLEKSKDLSILEAFTCIEQKLYIPVDSILFPAVSTQELKKMLIWDKQLFHPSIGFVGLESKDQVDLADLLSYSTNDNIDWSFAHPGVTSKPEFNQIIVVQPTAEELMDAMKGEIGQKPLTEIPTGSDGEQTAFDKMLDAVKLGLLKGLFHVGSAMEKIIPTGSSFQHSGEEGLLQKLNNWLQRNMEELEQKRNSEIQRLLKLFDEDDHEALQYAIPLNSPYLNRGAAPASTTLSRRPLDFNLRSLGGGRSVDTWNLDAYYHDLRTKYLRAAQNEIEKKDFKKAAYIYAHLIGDYSGAANVLKQGGKYREAAALYKDHLKNIPAAAECLEEGGLYLEAIELYKTLQREEKIGDLYSKVGQEEHAMMYYEKCIESKLSVQDYLDAARIMKDKTLQEERTRQTLLQGWKGTNQASACLKSYFDLIAKDESVDTEKEIREVYVKHTPEHKKVPYLDVMESIIRKKKNEAFADTIQTIAYEIVHTETQKGNSSVLHQLNRFFPEDQLMASDTSRYTSSGRMPVKKSASKNFNLNPEISWVKAVWHRNQFLAIGLQKGILHMARGNWYGNIEYYNWEHLVPRNTWYTFISSPYHSATILLHASEGIPITRKRLQKNRYFPEALLIYCPIWLHKESRQTIINEEQNIMSLDASTGSLTLHQYNSEGELKKSINCRWDDQEQVKIRQPLHPYISHIDGFYYTFLDKVFFVISDSGRTQAIEFESGIRLFGAAQVSKDFYLVISTNQGCFLCKPSDGNLNIIGNLFAEDLIPNSIDFITADKFVIVEKQTAFAYHIKDDEKSPEMITNYRTDTAIIAAMPVNNRHQFVIIEDSGNIGFFNF